jgi:MFS family permease
LSPGSDAAEAAEPAGAPFPHARAAALLFGIAIAWSGGIVGPVVNPISAEFDVSLTEVGLLSGTVFFGGIGLAMLIAAPLSGRAGVTGAMRLACLLAIVGNAIMALSPAFAGLLVGRALTGIGLGLVFVLGPVFARGIGGVRLMGLFGGCTSLGIALALATGSVLEDLGVDWRVGFGIAAALPIVPLLLIPRKVEGLAPAHEGWGFLPEALRTPRVYLLSLLFIAVLSIPLVMSAWIIYYLVADGMAHALAGVFGFMLFLLAMIFRPLGGRLDAKGWSPLAICLIGVTLGAAGLCAMAIDRGAPWMIAAVFLMGIGYALPYAPLFDAGARVFPKTPVRSLSMFTFAANVSPMLLIPLVGAALEGADGEFVLLALAAFVMGALVLNINAPQLRSEKTAG